MGTSSSRHSKRDRKATNKADKKVTGEWELASRFTTNFLKGKGVSFGAALGHYVLANGGYVLTSRLLLKMSSPSSKIIALFRTAKSKGLKAAFGAFGIDYINNPQEAISNFISVILPNAITPDDVLQRENAFKLCEQLLAYFDDEGFRNDKVNDFENMIDAIELKNLSEIIIFKIFSDLCGSVESSESPESILKQLGIAETNIYAAIKNELRGKRLSSVGDAEREYIVSNALKAITKERL